jgi:hypothetical protein
VTRVLDSWACVRAGAAASKAAVNMATAAATVDFKTFSNSDPRMPAVLHEPAKQVYGSPAQRKTAGSVRQPSVSQNDAVRRARKKSPPRRTRRASQRKSRIVEAVTL